MKLFILSLFFYILSQTVVQAGDIYKWLDIEGVKQFSNNPPPLSCKTPSCIKLQKKISQIVQQKKDAEIARMEAEQQEQSAAEQKKSQQEAIIKLIPHSSDKTYLAVATVLCVSFNNSREYKKVSQARKYLERDQLCIKMNEETEYTIIEKQDEFSNIRIYLKDGSSQQKWVETTHLIK